MSPLIITTLVIVLIILLIFVCKILNWINIGKGDEGDAIIWFALFIFFWPLALIYTITRDWK